MAWKLFSLHFLFVPTFFCWTASLEGSMKCPLDESNYDARSFPIHVFFSLQWATIPTLWSAWMPRATLPVLSWRTRRPHPEATASRRPRDWTTVTAGGSFLTTTSVPCAPPYNPSTRRHLPEPLATQAPRLHAQPLRVPETTRTRGTMSATT